MLKIENYMTIKTLWEKGLSKSEISRITGHDRKTIRKIIKSGTWKPERQERQKYLDNYKDKILKFLESNLSGVRIKEELESEGLRLSYRTLSDYINNLKSKKEICVRFHTKAGEEAQVDFGYVGLQPERSGKKRKAWIFNMRLSYSRLDYYEVVFDQRVETFIRCHINAFKYFSGVPEIVRIDNLKSAILEANFYEPIMQSTYEKFANHYGFKSVACRVRKPQEKGKVESGIKFIKNNFFAGRKYKDFSELENSLKNWQRHNCNSRLHGTTKKVPFEVFFEEEKKALRSQPITEFYWPDIKIRKVHKDCHIRVCENYYSVPYEYVGKEVEVIQTQKNIKILYNQEQITMHERFEGRGEFITQSSHYPKYKYFTPESQEYRVTYREKMQKIGDHCAQMFEEVIKVKPLQWYGISKGILSLEKQYSKNVVDLACKRALCFNIVSYQKVKDICKSGSYNLEV